MTNHFVQRIRVSIPLAFLAAASMAAPLKPVPFTDVHLEDAFWSPRVQTNLRSTLPHNLEQLESTGRLRNFDRAAGKLDGDFEGIFFNDSDVYKVLEGAAYTLAQKRDADLERRVDAVIDRIVAAQQADGYLYTYYTVRKELDKRHTDEAMMHETYCAGHLIEAAVAYHQATGKRKFLDAAIRLADYYDRLYGPGKKHDAPGHQEIELALVKLYNHTGNKRYLDLATFFVEERGHANGGRKLQGDYSQDHLPVRQHREIQGHAVRAMYLYCGVTDLAAISRDPGYIQTLNSIWHDVVDRKMYVTGGLGPSGSNEGFTTAYDLPNDSAYAETCAAIAMALWGQRMAILHRDARYADVTERAMYNGLLSGVSLKGDTFFYVNPLGSRGSHHRQPWFACACCPPNVVRLIPTVPGYAYATTDSEVYVNHFMGSTAKMTVGHVPVQIRQVTQYPWEGQVRFTVTPQKPTRFTMRLRVPGWVQGITMPDDLYRLAGKPAKGAVSVKINGKPLTAFNISRGYVLLNREWKPGDVVDYTMPMTARRIYTHPNVKADVGRVALQRGPIVYCLEDEDNNGYARSLAITQKTDIRAAFRPALLGGVTVLQGTGVTLSPETAKPKPVTFTAIPYYAWDNRAPGGMAVWVPENEKDLPVPTPPTVATRSQLTSSYTHADAKAPNDGLVPKSSFDTDTPQMDWWPHNGATEWLQYDFTTPTTVSGAEVYWFQDHPSGGCAVPASWRVEYRENGAWKPVEAPSAYGVEKDQFNRVTFHPVKTDGLRLVVTSQENLSAGLYEWRVME